MCVLVLDLDNLLFNQTTHQARGCRLGERFRAAHVARATLHAELGAIAGVPRAVTQGATVYVARVGGRRGARRNGSGGGAAATVVGLAHHSDDRWEERDSEDDVAPLVAAMSKPCPMCERALRHAGIRTVVYTDGNGDAISMRLR